MKTLAAILVEQHQPLELAEVELPAPGYGQVLVKLKTAGICGSQIGEMDGVKGPDKNLPHLLGHEGFGVVEEVGEAVTLVKPGDWVVMHWRPGQGIQALPARYRLGPKVINAGWVTTFQERAIVSENRITKVPADTDPTVAALLGCAIPTGIGAVTHDGALPLGGSVLILGCGSVGLCAVMGAKLTHAHPIVAVDVISHKLELARKFGASHTVDGTQPGGADLVRAALGTPGADVVIETTGRPSLIEMAYSCTSTRGRTVLVGVPPVDARASLYTLPLHFGRKLVGSHGGGFEPTVDIPRYMGLIQRGAFSPSAMVDHRCQLKAINTAIQSIRSGQATKCVIDLDGARA